MTDEPKTVRFQGNSFAVETFDEILAAVREIDPVFAECLEGGVRFIYGDDE